ncbi:MAG: PEGA domain-containing protein [Candidatus Uhrbacteria bacterium]|nr:PEGA domain-containing protein [Candidatus Uhrbacteria bacterium]
MHFRIRQVLFWLFATFFVVAAPVIVLYTAGYRYNPTSGRLQRTGVIAASTDPRGASLRLNGVLESSRTPLVVQRLMPGEYAISLERKDYHTWSQNITVQSGRTAYVNATMFADTEPELLLEEQYDSAAVSPDGRTVAMLATSANVIGEVWLYDIPSRTERQLAEIALGSWDALAIHWSAHEDAVILTDADVPVAGWQTEDGTAIEEDLLPYHLNLLPEYYFEDNGTNVELHDATSSNSRPVALLPFGTYTVVHRDDEKALFHDNRGRTYSFTFADNAVTSIEMPIGLLSWSEEQNLFLASDKYEVDLVNISTGERTLITRQSTPITAIDWHANGQAIFIATHEAIIALDRNISTSRVTTTLASDVDVSDIWVDQNGRNLYFLGSRADISGVYRLKLVK